MKVESYALQMGESGMVFAFSSEGTQGAIRKVVKYSKMSQPMLYNLAFGDWNPKRNDFDDLCGSGNGDAEKVLATVVKTVVVFTTLHPEALVFAKGITASRTRMNQIGLSRHLEEISATFDLYGLKVGKWELFERGQACEAFIAGRKIGWIPVDEGDRSKQRSGRAQLFGSEFGDDAIRGSAWRPAEIKKCMKTQEKV